VAAMWEAVAATLHRLQVVRAGRRESKKNHASGERRQGVARADCMDRPAFPAPREDACALLIAARRQWTSHWGRESKPSCLPAARRPARAGLEPGGALGPAVHPLIGIVGQPVDQEGPWRPLIQTAAATGGLRWHRWGPAPPPGVGALGLAAVPAEATGVLIHDCARCLVQRN